MASTASSSDHVEVLIAISHFAGVVVALAALMLALDMVDLWEQGRQGKRLLQEMSVKLRIPSDESGFPEWEREVSKTLEERFSDEHLRNRLADFCGVVLTLWQWLGKVVLMVLFIGIAWVTIGGNLQAAAWAWFVIGAWFVFSFVGIAFSFTCKLMTGRYPGQPKKTRAALYEAAAERDAPGLRRFGNSED